MVQFLLFSSLLGLLLSGVTDGAPTYGAAAKSCKNPIVRREWRKLTTSEKSDYITAVKCLQGLPSQMKDKLPGAGSRFEDFQGTHILSTDFVHFVGHFQPWHRYMVATYESELRSRCGYKGAQPYWNWSEDVITDTSIFSSPVFDPDTGFGGNGPYVVNHGVPGIPVPGRTGGGCVKDGPFKDLVLNLGPLKNITKNPHCLTRDISPLVTNRVLTAPKVALALSKPDFAHFDIQVQGGITWDTITYHGGGHLGVGGELGVIADIYASPGDPLFYLHHAQLDHLWWKWQGMNLEKRLKDIAGPDTQFAYPFDFHGPLPYKNVTLDFKLSMQGLVEDVTIGDVMDIRGGVLCYQYL
ncbi:Di-copper centre-containing protein [Wilcoxina mikolae CBS 423.85]|nr:Di-copper centre-containing protein [Wilcoxina mikolae CBS 423.85]